MANWYVSSVGYAAVTQFAISTAYTVGNIVRQLAAPAAGSERCFRCTTAGTSGGAEAAWTLTKGGTTNQGTAVFTEITGDENYQGTTWAAPHARLRNVMTTGGWTAAGDTIFVSADHADTEAAAVTLSLTTANIATPHKIICVTRPSASIPPAAADVTTGASVTTTGANGISFSMNAAGTAWFYGITFNSGTGAVNANLAVGDGSNQNWQFEQCKLKVLLTGTTGRIALGSATPTTNGSVKLTNCELTLSNASQSISVFLPTRWHGGSYSGTSPTNLFGGFASGVPSGIDVRDVDLSTVGASCYLVNVTNTNTTNSAFSFANCKLSASLAGVVTGTATATEDGRVDLECADSSTSFVREEHYRYTGSYISDTSNYLTAGASDGTTHKSWKLVSSTNCNYVNGLECSDIFVWVSAATHTLIMYLANTSSLTLKDTEIGFQCEYLASAATPVGTITSTFPSVQSAGSNLSTNSVGWTGLSSPVKQQVSLAITTAKAGWVRVRPILRRASTTVWVDPLITVS